MRLLDAISLFLILLLISLGSNAQSNIEHDINVSIPEVALLSLQTDGAGEVNFVTGASNVAGLEINIEKKEHPGIWINYSSVVSANQKRKVVASVLGEIPAGLVIKLKTSESRGKGLGRLGHGQKEIALGNSPVDVISGIGTCCTGAGVRNGHLLTYSLELDNSAEAYEQLAFSQSSLQILYTLTDDN